MNRFTFTAVAALNVNGKTTALDVQRVAGRGLRLFLLPGRPAPAMRTDENSSRKITASANSTKPSTVRETRMDVMASPSLSDVGEGLLPLAIVSACACAFFKSNAMARASYNKEGHATEIRREARCGM